ncbi:acyltransferase [Flavobacterium sp. ST-87]|uniref:Acyltransferase n=1 Tax=Flavobacterium plantiphilum TaxID=3163297 RepID=A0ABW8XXQ2_9FLAO
MKKLLRSFVRQFVKFLSSIFTFQFFQNLNVRKNSYYTIWISEQFKKIGDNAGINKPIYLTGGKYITIGNNFHCDHRLRMDAIDSYNNQVFIPSIVIGDNVTIQKDCHIGAIDKIVIGDNVLMGSKIFISDHSHGDISLSSILLPPVDRPLVSKGPIYIEKNVWLGEGVVILSGVTIGENSIIGANSVVTKSVPKNCVVAGNPAQIIKELI